jgi:hypothetical protein
LHPLPISRASPPSLKFPSAINQARLIMIFLKARHESVLLFCYDTLWGSRGNLRTFFVQLWCTMRQPRQYAHFFCSAMMHYEAAAAICALFSVQLWCTMRQPRQFAHWARRGTKVWPRRDSDTVIWPSRSATGITREYWIIYRGPSFLAVIWFGSSPIASRVPTPSRQYCKLDRWHTDCEWETICWRKGDEGGVGAKSYDGKKVWFAINYSRLSGYSSKKNCYHRSNIKMVKVFQVTEEYILHCNPFCLH